MAEVLQPRRSSRARKSRRDLQELLEEENEFGEGDSDEGDDDDVRTSNEENDSNVDDDDSDARSTSPHREELRVKHREDRKVVMIDPPSGVDLSPLDSPSIRKRGRPKGSKNKSPKDDELSEVSESILDDNAKKKRGRPKGSKNKSKHTPTKKPELTEEQKKERRELLKKMMPSGMLLSSASLPTSEKRAPMAAQRPTPTTVSAQSRTALTSASNTSKPPPPNPDMLKALVKQHLNQSGTGGSSSTKTGMVPKTKSTESRPIQSAIAQQLSQSALSARKRGRSSSPIFSKKPLSVSSNTETSSIDAKGGDELSTTGHEGSAPTSADPGSEIKKQKRPKLRKTVGKPLEEYRDSPDLSEPDSTQTSWNASEVIKGFLYVGAGWDQSGRCLVNRPNDASELKNLRQEWCEKHNMCYALNMAGSSKQRELRNIRYVLGNTLFKRIDMNDLDTWDEEQMLRGFEEGSEFIETAWKAHKEARQKQKTSPSLSLPTILVHCVAGVNRSPMCVVWWLCRYHNVHIRDAWEIVRTRRDSGAFWKNVTLGGQAPPEDYVPNSQDYESEVSRKFQHRYDHPGTGTVQPSPATESVAVVEIKSSAPESLSADEVKEATAAGDSDILDTSKGTETRADELSAVVELSPPKLKYPKALWFVHAERILSCHFRRRVSLKGISSPICPPSPANSDATRVPFEEQLEAAKPTLAKAL